MAQQHDGKIEKCFVRPLFATREYGVPLATQNLTHLFSHYGVTSRQGADRLKVMGEGQRAKKEWGRILVATDFSPGAERAYRCALGIAKSCQSELHLVHVVSRQLFPILGEEDSRKAIDLTKERAERSLSEWTAPGEAKQVPHHFRVVEGRPRLEIARLVEKERIDVVALGTRGCTGMEKLPLGSLTEKIFRTAEYPVLTAGAAEEPGTEKPQEIRQILYASNLTPYSDYAAQFVFSLAEMAKAKVTMVHVVEASEEFEARNEELLRDFFVKRLKKAIPREAKLGGEPDFVSAFGVPEEQILKISTEKRAGLIVLGVRAAEETGGYLPSRTAYAIVCQATCPVLTVPHAGRH